MTTKQIQTQSTLNSTGVNSQSWSINTPFKNLVLFKRSCHLKAPGSIPSSLSFYIENFFIYGIKIQQNLKVG